MIYSTKLTIAGLVIGVIGSFILILPSLQKYRSVEKERIVNMDAKGNYFQVKHILERKLSFLGFTLLALGFCLQLFGVMLGSK